jgi:Fas apoptotic inhibitory molecule (FAIM1).
MRRKWTVEIEDKECTIEVSSPNLSGKREISVNGKAVDSMFGLPKRKHFEIKGKKATLRRRSTLNRNLELYIEGEKIPRRKINI